MSLPSCAFRKHLGKTADGLVHAVGLDARVIHHDGGLPVRVFLEALRRAVRSVVAEQVVVEQRDVQPQLSTAAANLIEAELRAHVQQEVRAGVALFHVRDGGDSAMARSTVAR